MLSIYSIEVRDEMVHPIRTFKDVINSFLILTLYSQIPSFKLLLTTIIATAIHLCFPQNSSAIPLPPLSPYYYFYFVYL